MDCHLRYTFFTPFIVYHLRYTFLIQFIVCHLRYTFLIPLLSVISGTPSSYYYCLSSQVHLPHTIIVCHQWYTFLIPLLSVIYGTPSSYHYCLSCKVHLPHAVYCLSSQIHLPHAIYCLSSQVHLPYANISWEIYFFLHHETKPTFSHPVVHVSWPVLLSTSSTSILVVKFTCSNIVK